MSLAFNGFSTKSCGRCTVAAFGLVAGLIAFGLIVSNEFIRRYRTLYIVADFADPVRVEVEGCEPFLLSQGVRRLSMAEGQYLARFSGPVQQQVEIDIRRPYWSRWFDHPAWVLNVGGSAILVLHTAVAKVSDAATPEYSYHWGKTVEFFPQVIDGFGLLPKAVELGSDPAALLPSLNFLKTPAVDLIDQYAANKQLEDALQLAEIHLRAHPEDEQMLEDYLHLGQSRSARVEQFLRSRLSVRPVEVTWHRCYQDLFPFAQRPKVAALYDGFLSAEPTNSALVYLRGRLCPKPAESNTYYERACQLDSSNPYPVYALAYNLVIAGNWEEARLMAGKAFALDPGKPAFEDLLNMCRFALREYSGLEIDLTTSLAAAPYDLPTTIHLMDVYLMEQKTNEAERLVTFFATALTSKHVPADRASIITDILRNHLLYVTGDFAALEKRTRADPTNTGRQMYYYALIEQGRLAEAVALHPLIEQDTLTPYHLLTMAIAWRLAGDTAQAKAWEEAAIKHLAVGNGDEKLCSKLLARDTPPTDAELDSIALIPQSKATVLSLLALQYPDQGSKLSALANRLNVEPDYPYHLLQRVAAVYLH